MIDFSAPLKIGPDGFGLRHNNTLHGRSIYRPYDRPGHNVFKGYSTWAATGKAVGDALDCFAPGRSPVFAMHDGTQTRWDNDTEKLEVVYIEQGGVCTVYAHMDAEFEATGVAIKRGEQIGRVRSDLKDPHLHLEVWLSRAHAVAAPRPSELAAKLIALCKEQEEPADVSDWAKDSVAWVLAQGIMVGYGQGVFGGKDALTREQFAATIKTLRDKGYLAPGK